MLYNILKHLYDDDMTYEKILVHVPKVENSSLKTIVEHMNLGEHKCVVVPASFLTDENLKLRRYLSDEANLHSMSMYPILWNGLTGSCCWGRQSIICDKCRVYLIHFVKTRNIKTYNHTIHSNNPWVMPVNVWGPYKWKNN
jgi:hypothetical protein